ncbi:MAG: cyanophycin synthetase [Candidatus Pacebacteria bacterium]|nr:cyanophycin synthetase [Candidatus Paceibacterota bacterium]
MVKKVKKFLYFFVASYFKFFAGIYLRRWNPKVIVITGSQGKTTLLHLIESQLGERAIYSHFANSTFGIPFHILGLQRKNFAVFEWVIFAVMAPLRAFRKIHKEKLYVVEADCERPREGEFLADLLRPSITLWLSSGRSHAINFKAMEGEIVETAIAREFSNFAEQTKDKIIANGDVQEIKTALANLPKGKITYIKSSEYLKDYKIEKARTHFKIDNFSYFFPYLLPKEVAVSVKMTKVLCDILKVPMDASFSKFTLPPGRNSIFLGTRNTVLIDSSYNALPDSMKAMLDLFTAYPVHPKIAVLGDMIEQGKYEKEEHEKLGEYLLTTNFDMIIFVGPRTHEHTFPILANSPKYAQKVFSFDRPDEAFAFLKTKILGWEAILFKGARFLEGIVEKLLANPEDAKFLPRREKVWQDRRAKWGV